jgi:hypothetical protein
MDFYREERRKNDGQFVPDDNLKAEVKKIQARSQSMREGRFRGRYPE